MHLSDIIAVVIIVAFSLHHRISGILALLVVIACMQPYETKEGFALPKMPSSSTPAVTDDYFSWNTPDEFKQKYCIKGLSDDGWMYVLNSKVAPGPVDASGNPTYTDKSSSLFNNIDFATMKADPDCTRSTGSGGSTMGGIQGMCNPKCDWKMKQTKEGFTPTVEVSPIQNMKNVVKDNVRKAKTMTESFFSR